MDALYRHYDGPLPRQTHYRDSARCNELIARSYMRMIQNGRKHQFLPLSKLNEYAKCVKALKFRRD